MHHVRRSLIKSCGCHRKNTSTKHGMNTSREYSSWENMIQRCTNPNNKKYYLYGGRGINVCDRWLKSFEAFYEDMGYRPSNTTLDRIDSNKGYYKENCKWSNPREQLVNVRNFPKLIKHDGVVKSVDEWLIDLNIKLDVFKSRVLRGFNFTDALFQDNVDIITFNVDTNQHVIYKLDQFIFDTKFEKEKIIDLLDSNHEEPYFGHILRYLKCYINDTLI